MGTKNELEYPRNCSVDACGENTVAVLAGQSVCLNHFFERCYRRLDELEPAVRTGYGDSADRPALLRLVEKCSSRTLAVCLQHEALTNVDRSRLLDILMWTGELSFRLRAPQSARPNSLSYGTKRRQPVPTLRPSRA